MSKGTILKVAGPLVVAEHMRDANMFDVVRVSDKTWLEAGDLERFKQRS